MLTFITGIYLKVDSSYIYNTFCVKADIFNAGAFYGIKKTWTLKLYKIAKIIVEMSFKLTEKKISVPCNPDAPIEVILSMSIDGDEKAFRAIYDMLSGKMYSLCLRYAGNSTDADDLFQEGIIRVYKHLSGFKGLGSFEGWARRIFVNVCLDYLKNKQKLIFNELHENIDNTSTELTGIGKLTQADLLKIIQRLPNGYRTIVNLYLIEEYNHREIAEILGISEGTSKSQLSRAKTILQKSILETYGRYQ